MAYIFEYWYQKQENDIPLWLLLVFWLGKEESKLGALAEELVFNFEILKKTPELSIA